MTFDFEIKLLADCTEHVSTLAQLWFDEIGKTWVPGASIEKSKQVYQMHTNKDAMPLTFVALHKDKAIATASLRTEEGIDKEYSPFLGSLIVKSEYRNQGIGEVLINIVKRQAKLMGHEKLYLVAFDPTIPNWYTRLGWKYLGMDKVHQHPVTVMEVGL